MPQSEHFSSIENPRLVEIDQRGFVLGNMDGQDFYNLFPVGGDKACLRMMIIQIKLHVSFFFNLFLYSHLF